MYPVFIVIFVQSVQRGTYVPPDSILTEGFKKIQTCLFSLLREVLYFYNKKNRKWLRNPTAF